jgi:hypothetical protein
MFNSGYPAKYIDKIHGNNDKKLSFNHQGNTPKNGCQQQHKYENIAC